MMWEWMGFISGALMVAFKAGSLQRVVAAAAEGFLLMQKSLCFVVKLLSQSGRSETKASEPLVLVCLL